MGVSVAVGTIQPTTAVTGTAVAITGLGFQPKALILFTSGRTSATFGTGGTNRSVGFVDSAGNQRCYLGKSWNNHATMNTDRIYSETACALSWSDSDTPAGRWSFTSFDADGFTLSVQQQWSQLMEITYIAIGGTDVASTFVGTVTCPAATGTQAITAPGFTPSAVFMGGVDLSAASLAGGGGDALSVGFAIGGGSADQYVFAGGSQTGAANAICCRYWVGGECYALPNSTMSGFLARAAMQSLDATGFTLNWLAVTSGKVVPYLAIRGGAWQVGTVTARSDGTGIPVTGMAGTARGAWLLSTKDTAPNTAGTVTSGDEQHFWGAFSGTAARGAHSSIDNNGAATQTVRQGYRADAVLATYNNAGTLTGLMDVTSVDAHGFTMVMDTVEATLYKAAYIAVADGAAGGGGGGSAARTVATWVGLDPALR